MPIDAKNTTNNNVISTGMLNTDDRIENNTILLSNAVAYVKMAALLAYNVSPFGLFICELTKLCCV